MSANLRRYWFRFANTDLADGFRMGCGITAFTRDDAIGLLREFWPRENDVPIIADVSEDVDLRALDQNHVTPNIGDVTRRGVWFPNFS